MNNYVKYIKVADSVASLCGHCIRYVFPTTAEPFEEFIKLDDAVRVLRLVECEDVEHVVRCKDCVHGTDRTEEFGDGCVNPIACMMYSNDGEPDFFPKDNYCGFGERKDDETD